MRKIELLAPAKNLECGIAAIDHGADAVYIGATHFGARAAAGNSVEDIAELCRYARLFGVKVYATLNTIVFNHELDKAIACMDALQKAGVHAFLIQDMGVLAASALKGRDVVLHASTQTDNRTVEKVRWLRSLGFRRVVLARELSVDDIAHIHREVPDMELEAFVHGALCVSYSGVCYASEHCFGRSANRGECAQFCRMKFDLKDATGKVLERQRHMLSLKDMCRINNLEQLLEAGVVSFKIEGRLKDVHYVKNVVAAYSQKLNDIIGRNPNRYQRASAGRCTYSFEPNLQKTFNRGFTTYFLQGRKNDIFSPDTPKAMGEFVGHVKELRGSMFTVAGTASFANGDGLCFINSQRELEGFRVNRAEGNKLYPLKMPQNLRLGIALYRNQDVAFEKKLTGKTAERKIPVLMRLGFQSHSAESISTITLTIIAGEWSVKVEVPSVIQPARSPQQAVISRELSKLGGTPFICQDVEIPDNFIYFIPASKLSELRRLGVAALITKLENRPIDSSVNQVSGVPQEAMTITWQSEYKQYPYLYNIANQQAVAFYQKCGLQRPAQAFELAHQADSLLMQCRHCIRYALGYCQKQGGRKPEWKEPLTLELADGKQFRLEFDCKHCQMNVYAK